MKLIKMINLIEWSDTIIFIICILALFPVFDIVFWSGIYISMIQSSVLQTLSYFDLFDFPLTESEMYFYLWRSPRATFEQFRSELAQMVGQRIVDQKNGFYFLPGKEASTERRAASVLPVHFKFKRAKLAAKLISWIPFLRAIYVCNSVASFTAVEHSDIDFFIVAEEGRIWYVRALSNLILRLFGLRTYGKKNADKICLSFFVDTAHLDLSPWRVCDDDVYLAYWLRQLLPIYDPNNYFDKISSANVWVEHFLPNATGVSGINPGKNGKVKVIFEKVLGGKIGNMKEEVLHKMQLKKLRRLHPKTEGKGISLDGGVLKFHYENDRRQEIHDKWVSNLMTQGIYEK